MKRLVTLLIIASLMLCTACTEPEMPAGQSEADKKEINLALLNERWEKELDTNPHVMSEEYDSSYIDFESGKIVICLLDVEELPEDSSDGIVTYRKVDYPKQLVNTVVEEIIPEFMEQHPGIIIEYGSNDYKVYIGIDNPEGNDDELIKNYINEKLEIDSYADKSVVIQEVKVDGFREESEKTETLKNLLQTLKSEDILETIPELPEDVLCAAVNNASKKNIDEKYAKSKGYTFESGDPVLWDLEITLKDDSELKLQCDLPENIVKVTLQKGSSVYEEFFSDIELYKLVRYKIEKEYEEDDNIPGTVSDIIGAIARLEQDRIEEDYPPESNLLALNINLTEEFTDGNCEHKIYEYDYGLLIRNPEDRNLQDGMYFDGYKRLRGLYERQTLAVKFENGLVVSYVLLDDSDVTEDAVIKALNDEENRPKIYSEKEISEAIEAATEYFNQNFDGCKMNHIIYGGDDMSIDRMRRYDNGKEIVLTSSFHVSETDNTYNGYKWILKQDEKGHWEHVDHGY